ncbi:hypothetical protein A2U01_0081736, partial [Trifolium medium]|nr:hypothetical protein [Trifolium medium]
INHTDENVAAEWTVDTMAAEDPDRLNMSH